MSTQRELSVRELYPLAGANLFGALLAILGLVLLALPPFVVVWALISHEWIIAGWYGLLEIWLMSLYGVYAVHVWATWAWLGGVVWPIVVVQELILLLVSLYRHASGTVTWKGRSLYVK